MNLAALVDLVASEPAVAELVEDAKAASVATADVAAPEPLRPLLLAALSGAGRTVLAITSTYREAEALAASLSSLLGPDEVSYYPAWETLPHERLSPRSDTVGRRLAVLRRLAGTSELPAPRVVVAPVRAALQPQVTGLGQLLPVRIVAGDDYEIGQIASALVNAAYTRVDLVERRGEFAVRGGIIDVFPPTEEHPVRIDFFGDTVEEIRHFQVADQRTAPETITEVTAAPCREMLVTAEVRARARAHAANGAIPPHLRELFERIADGHAVDGMEALAPALVDGLELLVDVVPRDTIVAVADPEKVRARAHELLETSREFLAAAWAGAAGGGAAPIDLEASAYRALGDVRAAALDRGLAWWTLSAFAEDPASRQVAAGTPW